MLRRSNFIFFHHYHQHQKRSSSSFTHHAPPHFHPLRLFGDITCPFTHRCTIVAAHKRVPLDIYEVSNRDKPEWWDSFFVSAKQNKNKNIRNNNKNNSSASSTVSNTPSSSGSVKREFSAPILQVGSHFIRDSKVISEYLDSTYPPTNSLLPPMPHIRAHVRQFQSACADLIDAMYDYLHFVPLYQQEHTIAFRDQNNNIQVLQHQHQLSSTAPATIFEQHLHQQQHQSAMISTTTTSGKARGRKRSVLASQIVATHKLALPKTCSSESQAMLNCTEESLLHELRFQLRRVESFLDHSASPFLLGASPSLGDMTLIPFIDRFRFVFAAYKNFYLLEEAPALGRLMQAAEMLSSFQRTRLNAQEYLEAFDYLLDGTKEGDSSSSSENKKGASKNTTIARRLEIFTPPFVACPWTDSVRLTAALKNIEYTERPIEEFAKYERTLKESLKKSRQEASMGKFSSNSSASTTSGTTIPEESMTTTPQTLCDEIHCPATSLLSNATGENVIVRPSSGLHPIRSALCACQYLADAYSSGLIIPRQSLRFRTSHHLQQNNNNNNNNNNNVNNKEKDIGTPSEPLTLDQRVDEDISSFSQTAAFFHRQRQRDQQQQLNMMTNEEGTEEDGGTDDLSSPSEDAPTMCDNRCARNNHRDNDNDYEDKINNNDPSSTNTNQTIEEGESQQIDITAAPPQSEIDNDDMMKYREGDEQLPVEMMINLEIESHLDTAHQHYLLNYLEKHFGPRLVTYLHAKSQFAAAAKKSTGDKQEKQQQQVNDEDTTIVLISCRDRLREAVGVIASEIRAKPYAVCSNLCLADVILCSFFAKIDLNELFFHQPVQELELEQKHQNITTVKNDEHLLDEASLMRLKGCLMIIRQTVRGGLNQSIKIAKTEETKEKLIALRQRIFDEAP